MAFSIEQIKSYLQDNDWQYHELEEQNQLLLRMKLKKMDDCSLHIAVVSPTTAIFYTILPVKVPKEYHKAANDYFNRVNTHLSCGNFQLRPEDGEVRFRLGQFSEPEGELSRKLLEQLIHMGGYVADQYAPGLLRVIYAKEDPAAALQQVETGE